MAPLCVFNFLFTTAEREVVERLYQTVRANEPSIVQAAAAPSTLETKEPVPKKQKKTAAVAAGKPGAGGCDKAAAMQQALALFA
mmetsp:Transcript_115311/g.360675  ORF Transcript_115311/g.360675 Transcript_115311/m.360675 type:complete len:84 (+) Transcript_115311:747-998(+)